MQRTGPFADTVFPACEAAGRFTLIPVRRETADKFPQRWFYALHRQFIRFAARRRRLHTPALLLAAPLCCVSTYAVGESPAGRYAAVAFLARRVVTSLRHQLQRIRRVLPRRPDPTTS